MLFLGIKLVEECILTKFNRRKMIKPIYILLFLHQNLSTSKNIN
jgi:hypothetical protein